MYTVLVISAHPDDMEIACAGTLLKCKERGDRVVVCHLSDGNQGHEIILPEELGKMRIKEAQRSGSIGGFEVIWGGFHDLEIYDNNRESRDQVVDVIKRVDPDFIITHVLRGAREGRDAPRSRGACGQAQVAKERALG